MKGVACVIVDAQCGFSSICPSELPVAGAAELGPAITQVLSVSEFSVISKEAHPPNAVWLTKEKSKIGAPLSGHAHADAYWPAHCMAGTRGADLIPGLPALTEYDMIVYKGVESDLHPYGACYHDTQDRVSTGLIEFLRVKQVHTVLVCGLATDFCVKQTCLQLARSDCANIVLCTFAARGVAPDSTAAALHQLRAFSPRLTLVDSFQALHALLAQAS